MPWEATAVHLSDVDRGTLESWVRASSTEQRLGQRARIILAADRGESTTAIAAALAITPVTVSKWRTRFAREGMAGLVDAPRSGKPATYTVETEGRLLRQLDEPPPSGHQTWTGARLAQALG